MKNILSLLVVGLLFLAGCKAERINKDYVYTPICVGADLPQDVSENAIIRNMECGNNDRALEIAKEGAELGSVRMTNLYLALLESNNDLEAGLVYALRGAERGDGEAIIWVMKIVKQHNINSLIIPVSDMYAGLISNKLSYSNFLLDDYLRFSLDKIFSGDYSTTGYSNKFFEAVKFSLDERELKSAQELLKKINERSSSAN